MIKTNKMYRFCVLLLLVYREGAAEANVKAELEDAPKDDYIDGHPLKCTELIKGKFEIFEVLPGIGWDNLQNTELAQILDKKYHQCKLTEDGKYLIPDNVLLIPIKQSHVDIFAQMMSSMNDYTSTNAHSINGGINANVGKGDVKVSGSFSFGYQKAKTHFSKSSTVKHIARVEARYNRYRIVSDPNAPLHPSFKQRLLEIASSYYSNYDQHAIYQCQILIRDFGTHVQTSIEAGAILFKEDHIDSNSTKKGDTETKSWQIAAGISFSTIYDGVTVGGGLEFGYNNTKKEETVKEYNDKISYSVIKTFGGKYFDKNTSVAEWTDSLDNELVAIDRNGVPIYELVSTSTLPDLPLSTVMKVEQGVKDAFISYYKHNTYRGCMDPSSKNYDIKVNVADNSVCDGIKDKSMYFGGVFQSCTMSISDAGDICKDHVLKNPLTRNLTCPEGYIDIKLFSKSISASTSHKTCKGWLPKKCKKWASHSEGRYTAFWCARSGGNRTLDQRYIFGGIYSDYRINSLTGGSSCPTDFFPLVLGEGISICASEKESDIGVSFGGFFSCDTGNPLALSINGTHTDGVRVFPKRCPHGYIHQTIEIISDCEIVLCSENTEKGGEQQLPILKRPPYISRPKAPEANYTDIVLMIDGKWYNNEKAFKKMTEMESLGEEVKRYINAQAKMDHALAEMKNLYSDNADLPVIEEKTGGTVSAASASISSIIFISSAATLVCVLLATFAIIRFRKARKERNDHCRLQDSQYELEHVQADTDNNYGTAGDRGTADDHGTADGQHF